MIKPVPNEATRYYFLGCVDYAQHNFARLKPLLYSETGRAWEGVADRAWFPNEGLVYTIQADLRYAQQGSLWTFKITPNLRSDATEKDVYSPIQLKPAIELLISIEPADIETLRRLVTEDGLTGLPPGKSAIAVPELGNKWVVLQELVRDQEGRSRPSPGFNLKHIKVLNGAPEELCGIPTPSGQFVLPPIQKPSGESCNWLPPAQFLESLAADLKRWVPYGPQRVKAHAAAQALRDLAPHLASISALRADDAKVAMARAANLIGAAETVTGAAATIIELIVDQEPFKAEINRLRHEIRVDLESEILQEVDELLRAAQNKLLAEQAQAQADLEKAHAKLQALRTETQSLEEQTHILSVSHADKVMALEAQVDAVLKRAAAEPARLLAEWIGVSGFVSGNSATGPEAETGEGEKAVDSVPRPPVSLVSPIARKALGPSLFQASPARNNGDPRLLIIDAALRARELPVLIGPLAREFAEAWLGVLGGATPLVLMTDPTLLSVLDLMPNGPRGERAPLAAAFARARAQADPVIVLIDDLDPAAAGFWLPELARCQRHPERYGFPTNIHFLALIEADSRQMNLTQARVGELFPLVFSDCDPVGASPELPASPFALPLDLVQAPTASTTWPARVSMFESALSASFPPDRARFLAAGLADFLQHCKGAAPAPNAEDGLGALLVKAALPLVRNDQE